MKMSAAVWCAPVCTIMLAACSPNTALLTALSDRVAELESAQRNLERQVSDHRKLVQAAAADRERLVIERAKTERLVRGATDDIAALKVEFAGYKMDYRRAIQARAKGMALPDLTVGTAFYEGVVVSSATDTDLTVLHRQGMARVPLAKAPASVQALFAYDESVATGRPPPGVDYLQLAILQGKKSAEANQKLLAEMEEATKKQHAASRYISAPATSSTRYSWRDNNSFEGSYWAPINGRQQGPVSKMNSRPSCCSLLNSASSF